MGCAEWQKATSVGSVSAALAEALARFKIIGTFLVQSVEDPQRMSDE